MVLLNRSIVQADGHIRYTLVSKIQRNIKISSNDITVLKDLGHASFARNLSSNYLFIIKIIIVTIMIR